MTAFLADENVPAAAVALLRAAGFDVASVKESMPSAHDVDVIGLAVDAGRVLLTLDKDFGELAFRQRVAAIPGVVLFRPRLRSPEQIAAFMLLVLRQSFPWAGNFTVAEESRLRQTPLPN